jgi:D-xylose reductase
MELVVSGQLTPKNVLLADFVPSDYGNEKESGEGVARAIKEGLVKREDLFIVSKLWNSFHDGPRVEPIAKEQLALWGIDYFDLYIVHFPVSLKYVDPKVRYPPGWEDEDGKVTPGKAPIQETWQAMESLVEKGLAKSIGVSNFQGSLLLDLLRYAKIRPATLQIEHHPYLVQDTLTKLADAEGIKVTAYSSFGPQSFIELGWDKAKDTPVLFEHEVITKIAEKYKKTPAQVLLRWATQRGIAVIPKSNNEKRLAQNLDVNSFDMTPEELKSISALDRNLRFNNPTDVSLLPP